MRRWRLRLIVLSLVLVILPVPPGHAQEPNEAPLVIFIEDSRLETASTLDPGPDGVTRLEQLFRDQGAETRWLGLGFPLPERAHVVVLVRPLRSLNIGEIARLWTHIARGNNLLITLDPNGLPTTRGEGTRPTQTERSNSGLASLLASSFGIHLDDTFLAQPWFSGAVLASQLTTHFPGHSENVVQHPVVAPLAAFDLPVTVWGARSMTVDPLVAGMSAAPLLYTESAYGETDRNVFRTDENAVPLEINIGADSIGHLFIGALSESTRLESRVAVLGDSELLLNNYGLVLGADGSPLHLGNAILAQRLVAWLLERPVDEWPALPGGYTWLLLDGDGAEWAELDPLIVDEEADAFAERYDITEVHGFRDDGYLYLLVETAEPPNPESRVMLGIENTFDGQTDVSLSITTEGVTLLGAGDEADQPVPDGAMAIGSAIEIRLPLRVVTSGALLNEVCLSDSRTEESAVPLDCIVMQPQVVPVATTRTPLPLAFPPGPRVIVRTTGTVNLRSGPGEDYAVLDVLENGVEFAATGRTSAGDWVRVENASYSGWIAEFLVTPNIAIDDLPVVDGF